MEAINDPMSVHSLRNWLGVENMAGKSQRPEREMIPRMTSSGDILHANTSSRFLTQESVGNSDAFHSTAHSSDIYGTKEVPPLSVSKSVGQEEPAGLLSETEWTSEAWHIPFGLLKMEERPFARGGGGQVFKGFFLKVQDNVCFIPSFLPSFSSLPFPPSVSVVLSVFSLTSVSFLSSIWSVPCLPFLFPLPED
jgi:hypothetical protein